MNKTASFASGAKVNANLTLASGAELQVAVGGVAMGSTLTIHQGVTLDISSQELANMLSTGQSCVLFSGTDTLTLVSSDAVYELPSGTTGTYLASTYFTNLSDDYLLTYTAGSDDQDGGTLELSMIVPEPATVTLSLMALAGLAVRRRRK